MIPFRRVFAPLAVLTALVVSAAAGCSASPQTPTLSETPTFSPESSSPAASPSVTGTASPSGLPALQDIESLGMTQLPVNDADWVQVTGGVAWTALAGGTLQGLDTATGDPVVSLQMGGDVVTAMDVGYESLWVAVSSEPAKLVRVDRARRAVSATITLPRMAIQEEGSVGIGAGSVWVVVNRPERAVVQIDPERNRIVSVHKVPPGVVGARGDRVRIWLTDADKGELLRIDPQTARVVARTKVGTGARFFAVGEGAVWVQNNDDATVSRVDPRTGGVKATITVDTRPIEGGDLAVGGGFVWARVTGSLVSQIDPTTNTVVGRLGEAHGSGSVAADADAVWITAHDFDLVYRLPLTR